MPMLRDFGIVMALNVSVALLSALVVLPPVLVWAEESRGWVSKGLLRPTPPPFEYDGGDPSVVRDAEMIPGNQASKSPSGV
jgi:hypothetical protein